MTVNQYSLSDLIRHSVVESEPEQKRAPLSQIFEEEPVPLDVFIRDKKYMNNPMLGEIQYESLRHLERIYYPHTYLDMAREFDGPTAEYWAQPYRMINFATLQWGKGSGKDHCCRVASLRVAYLLSCLRSPQEYFGLPEQDTIHLLNIASTAPQAFSAFFQPLTRISKTGWFANHCEPKMNVISYPDKNIEVISGNSDAESQEGLNLMLGIADEVDAFRSKEELEKYRAKAVREPARSAESILKMLRTSAATRFPETFKVARISYPRYLGSTIQRLTDQARADNERRGTGVEKGSSRHYVSGPWLTWQVNPRYRDYELIAIEQTDELVPNVPSIIEDYEEDPAMAKAMYECKPSRAQDTYFKNMELVRLCMKEDPQPITVSYKTVDTVSEVTGRTVQSWEPEYTWLDSFKAQPGALYCLHFDMALKHDRAGAAMSHVVRWEEVSEIVLNEDGSEEEKVYRRPFVKTDFVFGWEASVRVTPPREIQVRWARQLIFELIKREFPILAVTYDGFQSADSLQILLAHGIEAERVSIDRDDAAWKNLRDLMYEGRYEVPYSGIFIQELESLSRLPNGKVDHPPHGSKDLADAVAGSVMAAVNIGGQEETDEDEDLWASTPSEFSNEYLPFGSSLELPIGLNFGKNSMPVW